MTDLVPLRAASGAAVSFRRPRQQRSRERFDSILDAAEQLLLERTPDDISIYTLADSVGFTAPSIYHFFPDAMHVFLALAERQAAELLATMDSHSEPAVTWSDLLDARFAAIRALYNEQPAARILLLGAVALPIQHQAMLSRRALAGRMVGALSDAFILPEMPDIAARLTEMITINDSLWALSTQLRGEIDAAADLQARRARLAYARTFLPEYLRARAA